MTIGDQLRQLRKKRGLTQSELALQTGLSYSFINQVERGKQSVRLDSLSRLAAVFGFEIGLIKVTPVTGSQLELDDE